ncbi:MAG: hypothetical protein RQ753_10120, partial [Desulfurivibrionaceae bacterium]|nr:hypothetical protein [Desulfurivibrionaceae bacterium]
MSPPTIIDLGVFQSFGHYLMTGIMATAVLLGLSGVFNLYSPTPRLEVASRRGLLLINLLFLAGFLM